MKIIEKLSEMMDEELKDAEKYIQCALMHKEDMPRLAGVFYRLSVDEMGHMQQLHAAATEIINEYKEKNREPPAPMMAVYNYLHEKQIKKAANVKAMQGMYEG